MKIHRRYLPQEIIDAYNLNNKFSQDDHIYIRIKKVIYGLKQAARLAYDQLCKRLGTEGYSPSLLSPNIWGHKTRATKFCLCIDDFRVIFLIKTIYLIFSIYWKFIIIQVLIGQTDIIVA